MTRHDGVDAAALAGCKPALITTTVVANSTVMPPQEKHGNRGLTLGPSDGRLCESGPGACAAAKLQRACMQSLVWAAVCATCGRMAWGRQWC